MNAIKIDEADAKLIEKLSTYNERKLVAMLDTAEKNELAIKSQLKIAKKQFDAIELKLNNAIKKRHFIKDALTEKWREPNENLKQAIKEYENGEIEKHKNYEEYQKAMDLADGKTI